MEEPELRDQVGGAPNRSGRFGALVPIPKGKDRAASCRPPSVLAPGSALGSCRHGALPSAQAIIHHRAAECVGQRCGGDQSRSCQPADVRQSRPARSSDSSTSPNRSFLTPRESRSFARVTGTPWPRRSSTRSSRPRRLTSTASLLEPSTRSPITSRCVASVSVATSCTQTGGDAGAARCSLESTSCSRLRRRYRFESPKAWMSLEPRNPWPAAAPPAAFFRV